MIFLKFYFRSILEVSGISFYFSRIFSELKRERESRIGSARRRERYRVDPGDGEKKNGERIKGDGKGGK